MPLDIVATEGAPKAIGPYSQAVAVPAGRLVFCSGQIPIDPQTGQIVGGGDIRQEAHRVMKNLDAVLLAAGASFAQVVKTTIYLTDLARKPELDAVWKEWLAPASLPARATVGVADLGGGTLVEISLVAHT